MNFKTITYVAAAVMAASCGNSSNKTAEQVATANEPRLVNVKVMTAETKDVPQSDVYSSIVEAKYILSFINFLNSIISENNLFISSSELISIDLNNLSNFLS